MVQSVIRKWVRELSDQVGSLALQPRAQCDGNMTKKEFAQEPEVAAILRNPVMGRAQYAAVL